MGIIPTVFEGASCFFIYADYFISYAKLQYFVVEIIPTEYIIVTWKQKENIHGFFGVLIDIEGNFGSVCSEPK